MPHISFTNTHTLSLSHWIYARFVFPWMRVSVCVYTTGCVHHWISILLLLLLLSVGLLADFLHLQLNNQYKSESFLSYILVLFFVFYLRLLHFSSVSLFSFDGFDDVFYTIKLKNVCMCVCVWKGIGEDLKRHVHRLLKRAMNRFMLEARPLFFALFLCLLSACR